MRLITSFLKNLKAVLTLFSLLFCLHFLCGQTATSDSLLFLNGKTLEGKVMEFNKYQLTFKTLKDKEIFIENYRLFSINWNGLDTTLYKYDSLEGNFLSEKDMKLFVFGERDAHQSYSSTFSNATGLVVGGIAGYFMEKEQSFILVATPLAYMLGTLIFPTKVKQKKLTDSQYIKENEYLRGYDRVARAKRTQNALKSTIIGMGIGFVASLVAN